MSHDGPYDIVPAHLDFISIYSPDLDDESQLVFHYTRPKPHRGHHRKDAREDGDDNARQQQEQHRRMRQIGLAQGMVSFARSFSGNSDVDSVETEKHRTVLAQFEKGWWILASIQLTCIKTRDLAASASQDEEAKYEYSAREVSPPAVLAQQLARAYRVFTLHQSHSLSDLFVRLQRPRFCALLDKFWTKFADGWDVMLHGNPMADALGGIRLAGGGELGVGVGEEEWGSAEREYLEELVRSTEGLIDMVVSRASSSLASSAKAGKGHEESTEALANGVIFSGVQALGPQSVRAITEWVASIAVSGSDAYGVDENPLSSRKRARRPRAKQQTSADTDAARGDDEVEQKTEAKQGADSRSGRVPIPPPLIPPMPKATDAVKSADTMTLTAKPQTSSVESDSREQSQNKAATESSDGWVNYLTLGYGNKWTGSGKKQGGSETSSTAATEKAQKLDSKPEVTSTGRFLVGLKGPLTEQVQPDAAADETEDASDPGGRLSLRTVHVEVFDAPGAVKISDVDAESSARQEEVERKTKDGSPILVKKRLRLIVYIHEPFIYALIFGPEEACLAIPSFYRELHQKLQPLHKALSVSTSAARAAQRIHAILPPRAAEATARMPVYDLVYDPTSLILRTSLPDIPSPHDPRDRSNSTASTSPQSLPAPLTRLDSLNIYTHTLALLSDTRHNATACERSVKTARNWWITALRLPALSTDPSTDALPVHQGGHPAISFRDAILVRRAGEPSASASASGSATASNRPSRSASGALGRLSLSGGMSGASTLGRLIGRDGIADGAESRRAETLAAGLVDGGGGGVDARSYLSSLFKLHR